MKLNVTAPSSFYSSSISRILSYENTSKNKVVNFNRIQKRIWLENKMVKRTMPFDH